MTVNEMKQKRFKLVKDARALLDVAEKEERDLGAEETTKYESMMAEVDILGDSIEREERVASLETEVSDTAGNIDRGQPDKVDEKRYGEAFRQLLASTDSRQYMRALANEALEMRSGQQMDVDTAGGYTVAPQVWIADLIKALDNRVVMRQLATKYQVPKAESMGAPSLDADQADPTWTAELLIGDEAEMTFGKRELFPHPLAQYIKVSKKLVRASALNIDSIVRDRLAYKAGVVEENAFLNGNGNNQPLGVFTASPNGISVARDVSTGNTATALRADNLIECKYALKDGYWSRARWIFNRSVIKEIRKLKDGEGNYLWRAGLQGDRGDNILDIPVIMSEYAPSTLTAGLYVGIIGDFSFYWIADALGVDIQVLVELFAATNQNGYVLRKETDGMPVLEEAFVRVTMA